MAAAPVVAVQGIYPTALTILVAMSQSFQDRTVDVVTPRIESSKRGVQAASTDISALLRVTDGGSEGAREQDAGRGSATSRGAAAEQGVVDRGERGSVGVGERPKLEEP